MSVKGGEGGGEGGGGGGGGGGSIRVDRGIGGTVRARPTGRRSGAGTRVSVGISGGRGHFVNEWMVTANMAVWSRNCDHQN